jgi:acetyl-CoA acetyltransferase
MNDATSNLGPIFDTNQVFDSVAVGAESVVLVVVVEKTTDADMLKKYPGESYSTTLAFTFENFGNVTVNAPYDLVMTISQSEDRV